MDCGDAYDMADPVTNAILMVVSYLAGDRGPSSLRSTTKSNTSDQSERMPGAFRDRQTPNLETKANPSVATGTEDTDECEVSVKAMASAVDNSIFFCIGVRAVRPQSAAADASPASHELSSLPTEFTLSVVDGADGRPAVLASVAHAKNSPALCEVPATTRLPMQLSEPLKSVNERVFDLKLDSPWNVVGTVILSTKDFQPMSKPTEKRDYTCEFVQHSTNAIALSLSNATAGQRLKEEMTSALSEVQKRTDVGPVKAEDSVEVHDAVLVEPSDAVGESKPKKNKSKTKKGWSLY